MRLPPLPALALALAAALLLTSCSLKAAPPAAPAPIPPPAAPTPVLPTPAPQPEARLLLSPVEVPQGGVVVVRLTGSEAGTAQSPRLEAGGEAQSMTPVSKDWVTLLPVSYAATPGPRDLIVTLAGRRWTAQFTVTRRPFPVSRVYVSDEKGNLLTDPQADRDAERIAQIKAKLSPVPLWRGAFGWPVTGNITTAFGLIRYVNDKEEGRHSGLDIAAPEGKPVLAPAAGRVVLADKLVVTGYTVILDHGLGLFTSYSHMKSFQVKVGQMLQKGDVIGAVGETGLATGPHLHWTVSIGSTPTDPATFLKGDPLAASPPATTP